MEGHYLNKTIKDNDLSLGDYVESGLSKELNNWYVIHFSGASEDQVRENPEQYLKLALDNLKNHYDVIGFLDNIDHFIARTKNLANLKIPFTNQKLNVTGVSKERSQISEQSLEVVTKKNSLDIRFFKEAEKISQSRS